MLYDTDNISSFSVIQNLNYSLNSYRLTNLIDFSQT